MLKHSLTVLACLVSLAGTGAATVNSALQHQAAKTAAHTAASHAAAARRLEFNTQIKQLEAVCAQQKANYNLLTPKEKTEAVAPVCSTNVVAP
ncbi:MAG TPA: hypothetical protein VHY59_08465 [Chthoniobacterales bacterium]|jgi:hypothetical protein|nr:hypothetical protein [Chthoniobacterales bacterium]